MHNIRTSFLHFCVFAGVHTIRIDFVTNAMALTLFWTVFARLYCRGAHLQDCAPEVLQNLHVGGVSAVALFPV